MTHSDVRRADEATAMIETMKDVLSGCTPTMIYQVCANIVGATVVEVAGPERQAVLDQTLAFGNILGRVVETTLIQLEDDESGIEEATILPRDGSNEPEAEEDDEGNTNLS